jgi:tetratricopeptide (TPR) repeat protein
VEENLPIETPSVPIESETASDKLEDLIIPVELQNETSAESAQIDLSPVSELQLEPFDILETSNVNEEDAVESITFYESNSHTESQEIAINETDAEAAQYSQTDYPLTDLSPEERQALDLEIIKYQQATSKNPRSYILWESLGEAYKSAGQYKEAIPAFQKAISMNPTNPMCHYRLGLVFAAEKREQEAIRAFKKVLELDPRSSQAHASLASQYRKMGLEEDAQEHIEKARAMQIEGESDYNHACLEAICGNNERALELLEVALQSKQTYVTWVQNDPDFHSLHNDHRFQMLLSAHATSTC